jgi:hypothetical protein
MINFSLSDSIRIIMRKMLDPCGGETPNWAIGVILIPLSESFTTRESHSCPHEWVDDLAYWL